jgi:hypothetical protein
MWHVENWKGLHMKKREEFSIIMKTRPFIHREWIEFSLSKTLCILCFVVFFIKGNSELWGTHLNKFIASIDSKNNKFLMYDESTSKNYKVNTKHFQVEQMSPIVYSYDFDLLQMFSIFIGFMHATYCSRGTPISCH